MMKEHGIMRCHMHPVRLATMCALAALGSILIGVSCISVRDSNKHISMIRLTVLDSSTIAVHGNAVSIMEATRFLRKMRNGVRAPGLIFVADPNIKYSVILDVVEMAIGEGYHSFVFSTNSTELLHGIINGDKEQFKLVEPYEISEKQVAQTNKEVVSVLIHNLACSIDGNILSRDDFAADLKRIVQMSPDAILRLECDRHLMYGELVRVLKLCANLGFNPPQLVADLVDIQKGGGGVRSRSRQAKSMRGGSYRR